MDENKIETLQGVNLNTRIIVGVEKIFGKFRFTFRDVRFQDGLLVSGGYERYFELDPDSVNALMPEQGTPVSETVDGGA